MRFGLIGRRLSHSYSKLIHEKLGRYRYGLIPLEADELESFVLGGDWAGLNVTIPYKQDVIPLCGELSDRARRIGSVNTLVRRDDGTIFGDNTDYDGFCAMADEIGVDFADKKVLILGSGGTSLTVQAVVADRGGQSVVVSRSGENHYGNLHLHSDADIIVNATPVGMFPDTDARPVDLAGFPACRAVLDVIYNPFYSRLILQARKLGIACNGGLTMLVAQAIRAAELFAGIPVPDGLIRGIREDLMSDLFNIVIIGMPGCGKTTVGKQLAAEMGLDFADTDEAVEQAAGMSVPDIFDYLGEAEFRQMEAEQAQRLGKDHKLVIATGGGIIKDPLNYERLKQNGFIVLLKRDLRLLSIKGRPLAKDRKEVMQLYRERMHLYEDFADIRISANCPIDEVVAAIRERIGR
ncbi:MAG: shikimate kinase [Anaerovoracaceae bacterium]|jgi:shikimate dehydrogenase